MLLRFIEFVFSAVLKLSSQCPPEKVLFIKLHIFLNLSVLWLSWQWCYIILSWMVYQPAELLRRFKCFFWKIASPEIYQFQSILSYYFSSCMALWNFCNYSLMFHFRVMFSVEYDILIKLKIRQTDSWVCPAWAWNVFQAPVKLYDDMQNLRFMEYHLRTSSC